MLKITNLKASINNNLILNGLNYYYYYGREISIPESELLNRIG